MKLRWLVVTCALAACGAPPGSGPAPATAPASASASAPAAPPAPRSSEIDPRFADAIRAAAPAYPAWRRVDEEPNVAPWMCAMPRPEHYGKASAPRMSEAPESPHDRKLYYLWASDREAYRRLGRAEVRLAAGFTIVKESFRAEPGKVDPPAAIVMPGYPPAIRNLELDGQWWHTGDAAGLYVMKKLGAPDVPGTDAGWIYGTIAPDGSVTSAGRVASCMGCHEDAQHERLFGLQ